MSMRGHYAHGLRQTLAGLLSCHDCNMQVLLMLALAYAVQDPAAMTGHTREVSSLAISPNGKLLASGSVDLTIRLWDTTSKQSLATLEGHSGEVLSLAFSPDGKLLASGETYKKVKIWDVASHKETGTFTDSEGAVQGLTFSADGKVIFAACRDNFVRVWNVGASSPAKKLQHNYAVNGLAVSPNGKILATIDDGGSVHLWDAATLKESKNMKHADSGRAVAFSADGKTLASGGGDLVKLWDVATGTEKAFAKAEANSVAFTPKGETLVVGTQNNLVLYFNTGDLSERFKAEKHERPVTGVVVTPDGKTAFTSSMDYTLRVWGIK
jgi:WD40 repeat protein